MKVWENLKKLWNQVVCQLMFPQHFPFLPNLHLCSYNSIETQYIFSISKLVLSAVMIEIQLLFCKF